MSRKNTLVTQIGPNGSGPQAAPYSLAASFNSLPTVVRYLDNCSFQINIIANGSSGTFQVQASNDYYINEGADNVVVNPGTWIPLTLAGGVPTVSGVDTDIIINLNQLPFYAIRLAYISSTPGTGLASIYITDKTVGA